MNSRMDKFYNIMTRTIMFISSYFPLYIMIIIFSAKYDYSSSLVMDRLKAKGENVIRINRDENTYQFEQLTENGIYFRNIYTEEIINLDDVTSCWWRRGGFSMSQFYDKSNKISEIKNDPGIGRTKWLNFQYLAS